MGSLSRLGGAVLATAAIASPVAVADDCNSLTRCDYDQTQTLIVPMRNHTLSALLPVKDTDAARRMYARLLPPGYEVPAQPMVGVYMVSVDIPTKSVDPVDQGVRGMADITHYLEGSLSLRAVHDHKGVKETGWWHLGMPVDSELARTTGLAEGYPKYRAVVTSAPTPSGGWDAIATVGGRPTLSVHWEPDASARSTPDLDRFLGEPFYTLAAPLRGPEAWRTRLTAFAPIPLTQVFDGSPPEELGVDGITRIPAGTPGRMTVDIDPDINRYDAETPDKMPDLMRDGESLADMVEPHSVVIGSINDFQQTLLFQMNREAAPFTGGEYWTHDDQPGG